MAKIGKHGDKSIGCVRECADHVPTLGNCRCVPLSELEPKRNNSQEVSIRCVSNGGGGVTAAL